MSLALFNRDIPDEAHQPLQAMGPAGVRVFAFTPSGGRVLVTSTACSRAASPTSASPSSTNCLRRAMSFGWWRFPRRAATAF